MGRVHREMRYSKKIDGILDKFKIDQTIRYKNVAVERLIAEGVDMPRDPSVTKLWSGSSKRHGFGIDEHLDARVREFTIKHSMTYQQAYFECMCVALKKYVAFD